MMRFWVTAWMTASALLVVGCAQETVEAPRDRAEPAASSTSATVALERTDSQPSDEQTAPDPPAKQAGLFFPRSLKSGGMYPSALGGGRLVVKDRCIYMAPNGGGGLVVWPYGYSLRRQSGEILVSNRRGKVVAKVGDKVRMGGGQITQEGSGPAREAARRAFEQKREELGVPDRCRGPLWVSSGVVGQ